MGNWSRSSACSQHSRLRRKNMAKSGLLSVSSSVGTPLHPYCFFYRRAYGVSTCRLFQRFHPDKYSSWIRFHVGNWSHSVRNEANGSNALGRNRIHDEYSPGSDCVGVHCAACSPPASLPAISSPLERVRNIFKAGGQNLALDSGTNL